jgi:hypothetical protein
MIACCTLQTSYAFAARDPRAAEPGGWHTPAPELIRGRAMSNTAALIMWFGLAVGYAEAVRVLIRQGRVPGPTKAHRLRDVFGVRRFRPPMSAARRTATHRGS